MNRPFPYKGYARVYVKDAADCPNVEAIIKELDEFEFEYLPDGMVAPFSEFPKLIYTHKFDHMDMDLLTAECWKRGIFIWACSNGTCEFMDAQQPDGKRDAT